MFPVAISILYFAPPNFWFVASAALLYGAANGIMTIVRGIVIPETVSKDADGVINGALAATIGSSLMMVAAFWWTAWHGRPTANRVTLPFRAGRAAKAVRADEVAPALAWQFGRARPAGF